MATLNDIRKQTEQWLDNVVIGLNLCPFAAKPRRNNQIDIVICPAEQETDVLQQFQRATAELQHQPHIDTRLFILAKGFDDFYYFNQFLNRVDSLITTNQWQGTFQIATFHPEYQFSGTLPEDKQNLTNQAPYPILHILRESSVEKAISYHPDVDDIPMQNIKRMELLSQEDIAKFFPYLTKGNRDKNE
ncbi:DUF1415 domain-containing protein [Alteromonadaceae bacterium BrNp21-10]|nr:DUF1415 domain-containing protein [Alteromonadaceae bacterium BrNp21-10]